MLLRIFRGTVARGREADFGALCRRQVADRGRAPGLVTFMAGYRRVTGADRFILSATWQSEAAAIQAGGDHDHPTLNEVAAGVAEVESVELYDVLPPVFTGIVDAPGGVLRTTHARVSRESRDQLVAWLAGPRRRRQIEAQQLLVGWAMGERAVSGSDAVDLVAVSAWPSPLVIESVADPDRAGRSLFAVLDQFAPDATSEQYRAMGLELPTELADPGSRRILAARFATREAAEAGARELSSLVGRGRDAQITVAPLGAPGSAPDPGAFVLVARVEPGEFGRAERLIADQGGDVILNQRETQERPQPAEPAEAEPTGEPAPGLPDLANGFSPSQ